jgi:hypothetical protein
MKKMAFILVCTIPVVTALAQQSENLLLLKDTGTLDSKAPIKTKNFLSAKSIIIPCAGILYGFGSLRSEELKNINIEFKEEILEEYPRFKTNLDDYLMFAPAAGAFLLEMGGIKGKHNLKDKTIIYGIGFVISTTVVFSLKKITHQLRPDGSKYNSFPSGHTTSAFLSAEFLNQEYGFRSPWYSVAGYTLAAGTGAMRMYNNKHWFGDVLAGAGIGILSTKASYWIFQKWEKKRNRKYDRKKAIRF